MDMQSEHNAQKIAKRAVLRESRATDKPRLPALLVLVCLVLSKYRLPHSLPPLPTHPPTTGKAYASYFLERGASFFPCLASPFGLFVLLLLLWRWWVVCRGQGQGVL